MRRRPAGDGADGLYHRAGQEGAVDNDLPDERGPQLRRNPARAGRGAEDRWCAAGNPGQLGAGPGRDRGAGAE